MSSAPLEMQIRVYLEDTDAGGVVYHASYIRFMERARTEFLRRAGLEQSASFEQDASYVVHSLEMRYLKPAFLDDHLRVRCEVAEARSASLRFAHQIYRADGSELCCEGSVKVACISLKTKRPRRLPATLLERLG